MTAEDLYQNQKILIDYLWGHLSSDVTDEIDNIISKNDHLNELVNSLLSIGILLNSEKSELIAIINKLDMKIEKEIKT